MGRKILGKSVNGLGDSTLPAELKEEVLSVEMSLDAARMGACATTAFSDMMGVSWDHA